MAGFVAGHDAADGLEVRIASPLRQAGHVAVGDAGRPLLEGRIDEAFVGVLGSLRVEAIAQQVLDRRLDGAHIDATGEKEVLVE